jgi:DNA-binding GntR family transcriptional regulator
VIEEAVGQPAYQRVAADLRSQIASGRLTVGAAIPSTKGLTEQYGVSSTVTRAAVNLLRRDGLVIGRPGKAVYVVATPNSAAERATGLDDLARQIQELRGTVANLAGQLPTVDEIRQQLGRLQAEVIELYAKVGLPYPPPVQTDQAP